MEGILTDRKDEDIAWSLWKHRAVSYSTVSNDYSRTSTQLNLVIAMDNLMGDLWYPLCPHHNVFTLTEPKEISGNLAIPKPVLAIMSNWILSKEEEYTQEQINNFNAIPGIEV